MAIDQYSQSLKNCLQYFKKINAIKGCDIKLQANIFCCQVDANVEITDRQRMLAMFLNIIDYCQGLESIKKDLIDDYKVDLEKYLLNPLSLKEICLKYHEKTGFFNFKAIPVDLQLEFVSRASGQLMTDLGPKQ